MTTKSEVTISGIALSKRVLQLYSARGDGDVVFRKKLSSGQVLVCFAQQPNCVAIKVCATAHGWGREFAKYPVGDRVMLLSVRVHRGFPCNPTASP